MPQNLRKPGIVLNDHNLALRRQRWEDHFKFRASLGYTATLKSVMAIQQDPVSENKSPKLTSNTRSKNEETED